MGDGRASDRRPRQALATAGGTAFSLRPAGPADEAFLYELYADRWAEELAPAGWGAAPLAGLLRMQFEAQRAGYAAGFPGAEDWVALIAGAPAGRLLWDRQPAAVSVVDIAVLRRQRGQGVGTALVREVQAVAAGAGVAVDLSVEARLDRLVRWYERLGFMVTSADGVYARMRWAPADGL